MLLIDCAEFVFVGVGVITMDRKDLGNKASARAAVEVHYNVGVRQARGENPARTPLNYIEGKKRQNLTEKMKVFLYGMDGSMRPGASTIAIRPSVFAPEGSGYRSCSKANKN